MPICLNCNSNFPNHLIIDNKRRNLSKRKYCISCSPFNKNNRLKLHINNNLTRYCSRCKITQELKNFYKRKRGGYKNWCKKCLIEYNPIINYKNKIKAIEYKGGQCSICGYNKCYWSMHFHHTNPNTKEFNLNRMWRKKWDNIVLELEKCILLCSNCHGEVEFTKYINKNKDKNIQSYGVTET